MRKARMTSTTTTPGLDARTAVTAGAAVAGVLAGVALWVGGAPGAAQLAWAVTTGLLLLPLSWSVIRAVLHRDFGVDAIALLSMGGAIAVGEYLAGAVVAMMLAGGNALEAFAQRRARRELSQLVSRMPTRASVRHGTEVVTVPVSDIAAGDRMIVRVGEIVPADGALISAEGLIDSAALTGESLPLQLRAGDEIQSGTVNVGAAIEIAASRTAADSTYAALVRVVQAAEQSHAPFIRMADRYAAWFLPWTLLVAAIAWTISGDPVRAVAVLVVATPCPLILAAPVALVAGVSRAARGGVILKGAAVVEGLAAAHTVLLDKTGTLTLGTPAVEDVRPAADLKPDELLRLAASLDQASTHVMAQSLVAEARLRGFRLSLPTTLHETPGHGISGTVAGHVVAVGTSAFLEGLGVSLPASEPDEPGKAHARVALDGRFAGSVVLSDRLRPDAVNLVRMLRDAGVARVILITGDQRSVAEKVATAAGVDQVYAEMSAEAKLGVVRALRAEYGAGVVMVGDGINDAPALALADVGIAVGAGTATVASETADAVVVVDRIDKIAGAITIGRRSMRIARQSVIAGLALSSLGMAAATVGALPPVAGALFQEVIDVAVILNALRALNDGGG
jgi:heavy metal translocating P-type ATPase